MQNYIVFVNGKYVDEYSREENAQAHVRTAINLGNEAYYELEGTRHPKPALSQTQIKVLRLIGFGHKTTPGSGLAIHINGSKVCNVDTMKSLQRRGLAEQIVVDGKQQHGCWQATEEGKSLARRLSN